jgi:cytoskeletal protein RodZ
MKKFVVMLICLFVIGLFSVAIADDTTKVDQGSQQPQEEDQITKEAKILPSTLMTDEEAFASVEEDDFSYSYADDE